MIANMWTNEAEEIGSTEDKDGNGYKGDRYGYNFVKNTGVISWTSADDTGHGTHVAGTIAAENGNSIGVSGIAGGDGNTGSGVKIMTCQLFDGQYGATLAAEAKAIKYAADNGAVVLQCSWGYNSPDANEALGYVPGPKNEQDWENQYPLEKEALDYFIHNAGSPNGVIDGGLAILHQVTNMRLLLHFLQAIPNVFLSVPSLPTILRLAIPTMVQKLHFAHRAVTAIITERLE